MRLFLELKVDSLDGKPLSNYVVADEVVLRHKTQDYIARIQTCEVSVEFYGATRVLNCKNVEVEFEDVKQGLRPSWKTILRELRKFDVQSITIDSGGNDYNDYAQEVKVVILSASLVHYNGREWIQKDFSYEQLYELNNNIEY